MSQNSGARRRPAAAATFSREALRQQALLAAVAGADGVGTAAALAETGVRASNGIAAYGVNADTVAERALASTFPTVRALIGADDFGRAARRFRRAHPPERGDLGEFGAGFAAWLHDVVALAEWPYLGDCAALDLAVHRCERAADAVFDAASLARLQDSEPSRLQLRLMPGTAVLASAWPVVAIHAAHRAADPDFSPVRAALAERTGESVLVVREGWRGAIHAIDEPTFEWTRSLLEGADLARALDRAGPAFDFATWLAAALRGSWLQGVECFRD